MELKGTIVDIDYVTQGKRSVIRITLRGEGNHGSGIYAVYDHSFYPYFYIVPGGRAVTREMLAGMSLRVDGETVSPRAVEEKEMEVHGKKIVLFKVSVDNTKNVPKLSEAMVEFGERFEYDIVFWKRYLIDMGVSPMSGVAIETEDAEGLLLLRSIKPAEVKNPEIKYLCFDIETYNPVGAPRPEKDEVIMISYACGNRSGVLTTKKIDRQFVALLSGEKEMIEEFGRIIRELDADAIVGYNSSNFDIPYLIARAERTKADFRIGRYDSAPKQEHHGLIESVKIPGRMNVDVYNIAKFVSVVGASEKLIRANRFTLSEVYAAITGDEKKMVDRRNIWQIWDGSEADREELADYSLGDAVSLEKVFLYFLPLEVEVSRVTGTTLAETCISTTGQLVEYLLMRYAHNSNEIVPNRPVESEITGRLANPIEGAYVKTPEAGIYKNIVVYDFRGLYPSIIIAYNIDPSTLCTECADYHEAPDGTRFRKAPQGIIPKALRILIKERSEIKKAYKKDPDNAYLMARSQALKILANSFYGYLGYARSRWYSRGCASSVTALGRSYISQTMETAEKAGFRVLYGDTDSIFILRGPKPKEDAERLLEKVNGDLPDSMELELEDFYTSGVFVGKRGAEGAGAKKKYALLSESGRIKIRGFELVRRDWSNISRETQRAVLDTILKDGSKEKAIAIVKEVVKRLREGRVQISDLVIRTQLRKKIDSYDSKSPELSAAKKAIKAGTKTREELEGATIGYVVTRKGSTVSEKAELEEFAQDYDPDYYINHQIIPSTLKILKELGVNEEELINMGSQKKL